MSGERRTVALLSACQALLLTGNVILIALNGLAGHALAADKSLATLPVTAFVVGGSLMTMPASLLMQRIGRRAGFSAGAALGLLGSALCALAVHAHAFWLLCVGNFVLGTANGFAQYYRFAAADAASDAFKSRAISYVLAGGILGGVIGPETSKLTMDLLPTPFLGSYLSLLVFGLATLVLVRLLEIPMPTAEDSAGQARPLLAVVRQPVFIVAVVSASVGYAVMNLLMTATPLAMHMHHHAYDHTALVIEWHVIGMFAPSFVTGTLIARLGVLRVLMTGALLMFGCVAVGLSGATVAHFWVALVLLGIGWNFLYIGGTTLLTEAYTSAERAKVQGVNDFVIFASMGVSSFASGLLVTSRGWDALNYASLPFLALAALAIAWLGWRGKLGLHAPAQ